MIASKVLDELARTVSQALPRGVGQLREDFGKNVRAAFATALARADLVTREEFDVQTAVLARTREKLAALEKQVATLEKRAGNKSRAPRKKAASKKQPR